MLKVIFSLITVFCFTLIPVVHAIEDPLSKPNNKFGIHILFPAELSEASRLVNSNGGDWGYVTIPIQAKDRDLEKWQRFMDDAKKLHLIPIIRIATENYYFDTKVWRKPEMDDVLDFANFLNSLEWPAKNRYVVIFNEVNRSDEWGNEVNPAEYARILEYAVNTFKSKNSDFFVISAGLDNASANVPSNSSNQYDFMIEMNKAVPGIFGLIDGLGSHSYPNPAFSQVPWVITNKNINSFKFEKNLAYNLSGKNLPVFITETGWSHKNVPENQIASYFIYAFASVWSDNNVTAVTPFLLQAGTEPFLQFTLLNKNGDYNEIFKTIQKISKIKGEPDINHSPNRTLDLPIITGNTPLKSFSQKIQYGNPVREKADAITVFLKWFLKLFV